MVAIFAKTTTCLSVEFLEKLPSVLLDVTIENINNIPGVDCEKIDDTFWLKGQWHDLVTAYVSLEQCIYDKDEESDKDEIKTEANDSEHDISPDIDYNFVTIKQEKGVEEWQERERKDGLEGEDDDDAEEDVTEITDPDETELEGEDDKNEVKRKLRRRTRRPKKRVKYNLTVNIGGRYACTRCDYVGKLEKHLQNHIVRKHERQFRCNVCDKKYGYKADLDRHKVEVHNKTASYYCNICDKYLKTKAYIDDHMSMHTDNYVYQCKTCEKSFSTKQVFGKHMKQKHPSLYFDVEELEEVLPDSTAENKTSSDKPSNDENASNDDTNDGIEDKEEKEKAPDNNDPADTSQENDMEYLYFPEIRDKIIHENNLVKVTLKRGKNRGRPRIKSFVDGRTEFPCNLCNYIGKKECHLEYHIIRNHSQKFICDICQKQFGYNWDLKRHREQVHAEASYICHICSKAYKVKKSFDEHLKSHEEGYVKSVFPCTICDKQFSAKQVLENHIKIKHLGVPQKEKQKYLCQTCGAEFYHKYSYQSHMNKHQGLMPYNCDICGKAFASEHSVKEHQITHRDSREFHCHICPKSFKTSSALNAHVAIHANKRDFKCSVCGKGFIQKQSLIRHERIHSGYKPFTCGQCSRVFTDSATIRKHMILVHKSDPHDWQGDVISDLKKQGEFWLGDLTSEPKKEPDFRRKADRERLKGMLGSVANIIKGTDENVVGASGTGSRYQQDEHDEMNHGNDDSLSSLNHMNNQSNLHRLVSSNEMNLGGGSSMNSGGSSMNSSGSGMNSGGSSMNPGGSNMNQGGSNMNPGGSTMNQGGSNMNQGGSNMNQGGSSMNQGGSNMNQGGSSMNPSGSGGSNMNQGGSNMNQGGSNMNQSGSNMNQGGSNNAMLEDNSNNDTDRADYWHRDFSTSQRSVDSWHPGNIGRQPDPMRVDSLIGMKRSSDYFQPSGIVVDASRHSSSEYFHGDNIPDPRKQIEFWQGQRMLEGKHPNDPMQGQLTTLQNMNYHSQS